MRVFAKISKVMSVAGAIALMTTPGCSCGDDDASNPDARVVIDAQVFDADTTDATVHDADIADLRSGTVAVTQVQVSNTGLPAGIPDGAVNGAGISVTYLDETTRTVAPTFGAGGIGECTVFVYDVGTTAPPDEVSEGVVTITGAGLAPASLAGNPCVFVDALGEYKCSTAPAALPDMTTLNTTGGVGVQTTTTLTVPGMDFPALGAYGMSINIGGFTNDLNNGTFMVVATTTQNNLLPANTIAIINFKAVLGVAAAAEAAKEATADSFDETYSTTIDAGPTSFYALIAGATPIVGGYQFITDYTEDITIAKTAGTLVDAFSITIKPSGGSALTGAFQRATDGAYDLHDLGATASGNTDKVFSCIEGDADSGDAGIVDTCGVKGNDIGAGQIYGWTLSGSTSDGSIATGCDGGPCLPIQMPDPSAQWAEFTCRGGPFADSITLSAGALDAIMGTSPTRVQSRLLRITADLASHSPTAFVIGSGFVGFWDVPAP